MSIKNNKLICTNCNTQFSISGIRYHVKNNVCLNKNNLKCPDCDDKFTSNQGLKYHISNNVCKNLKICESLHINIPIHKVNLTQKQQSNAQKQQSNAQKQQTNIIINNNNNNNTFNIVPLKFLDASFDYEWIGKYEKSLLYDTVRYHPADPIRYFIEKTTCNLNKPLYNSIHLRNDKEKIIKVSNGKEYIAISKKQAIKDLIERTRDIIQDYKDSDQNIPDKFWERCTTYLENVENYDSSEQIDDLRTEIIVMLINISRVMFSDDWQSKLKEQIDMYNNVLSNNQ